MDKDPDLIPEAEHNRLKALHNHDVLGPENEDQFTQLTDLISDLLDVPIAMLSLVGEGQLTFQSCLGFDEKHIRREDSFCQYAVYEDDLIVIPDARQDSRFDDNKYVHGEAGFRAYMGAPLRTENGHVLGTFCVLDYSPRQFSSSDQELIQTFADIAMDQIKLNLKNKQLTETNEKLRNVEEELTTNQRRFNEMAENIEEIFWLWSADGEELIYINPSVHNLFGLKEDQFYEDRWFWFEFIVEDDKERVRSTLKSAWEGEFNLQFRIVLPHEDRVRWIRIRGFPVKNDEGETIRLAGTAQDITSEKKARERLEKLARTDDLTELLNRHTFFDRLEDEIERARRYDSRLSLIMLDIDDFKTINDDLGHVAGDEVLKTIASRLESIIRAPDITARYGGDEFVILLPETPVNEARVLTERISTTLHDKPIQISQHGDISIECSMGIAGFDGGKDQDEVDMSEFVHRADQAMYRAKQSES